MKPGLLYIAFGLIVVLPFLACLGLATTDFTSIGELGLALLTCGVLVAFMVVVGPWDFFSLWLRSFLVFSYIGAAAYAAVGASGLPILAWPPLPRFPLLVVEVALTALLAGPLLSLFKNWHPREDGLHLDYPLRGGRFYVHQGGASELMNYHVKYAPMRYALDLVQLNLLGCRARGLYPSALDRYVIFGATVVAPCNGVVTRVVNDQADFSPPLHDESQPAGNYVIIGCGDVKVLLAHLQQGSVQVKEGDHVRKGQPLARIGNSGNTSEPHLHIHAERGGLDTQVGVGVGIPLLFGKRFLRRNDTFVQHG